MALFGKVGTQIVTEPPSKVQRCSGCIKVKAQLDSLVEELGYHGFDTNDAPLKYPHLDNVNPMEPVRDYRQNQPVREIALKEVKGQFEDKLNAVCEYLGIELKTFYELNPPKPLPENIYTAVKRKKKSAPVA